MIALLTPLFQGEWMPYGEALACSSRWPCSATPVAQLIHDEMLLRDMIRRRADELGDASGDLRAAASVWSMEYLQCLLPPVVVAASVLQHVFPVQAREVAVELASNGAPTRFHIRREDDPMAGEAAITRYDALLWHHLEPLFAALSRHTRLPRKILWSNAARHLENIFDNALALTGEATPIVADRQQILHQPTWQGHRINPLYGKPGEPAPAGGDANTAPRLHRQCCLYYRLPGHDYCSACPLDPQHRHSDQRCHRAATPTDPEPR